MVKKANRAYDEILYPLYSQRQLYLLLILILQVVTFLSLNSVFAVIQYVCSFTVSVHRI